LDRVLLAMQGEGLSLPGERTPACFVVAIGEETIGAAHHLVTALRAESISALTAFEDRPLKAQLKMADRAGAAYAAIIGARELTDGTVTLRRLSDGSQETVPIAEAP